MRHPYDVQLAWFTSFVTVVERGSFTSAARAMHRAQPRISSHVAELERVLGVPLLERTGRGVRLTEAGARFLPHARAALANVRSAVESVDPLAGTLQGHVVVGSYPGASAVLLAPLIKRFRDAHPAVSVELHEGSNTWLEDGVAHGDIDISVRPSETPLRHPNITGQFLFHEPIVLVVRDDHRLATPAGPDLLELADEAVVVTGVPASGVAEYVDRLLSVGVQPAHLTTVTEPTTLIALVRAGLGVGLLGALAAEVTAFGDIVVRSLAVPLWQREIRIYANRDRTLSAAAAAFRELLIEEVDSLWPRVVAKTPAAD